MLRMRFVVRSIPAPQGSKRHIGKGILIESSARVKPWRDAVRLAAIEAMGDGPSLVDAPLMLTATFCFARPKSHYRTGRNAHLLRDDAPKVPTGPPDLSKLLRSTEDAITDAGVWKDDSRVVQVSAFKRYCAEVDNDRLDILPAPGAVISIREVYGPPVGVTDDA